MPSTSRRRRPPRRLRAHDEQHVSTTCHEHHVTTTTATTSTTSTTRPPAPPSMVAMRHQRELTGLRASAFRLGEPGRVTRLVIYLASPAGGSQRIRPVIYRDAAGAPGALAAAGPEQLVAPSASGEWVGLPLATPVSLTPGTYWLGMITGDTSNGDGASSARRRGRSTSGTRTPTGRESGRRRHRRLGADLDLRRVPAVTSSLRPDVARTPDLV